MRRGSLLVAGCCWAFLLLGCSRETINRPEWERMSREDQVLYVQSLLGAEKARDAKGGRGRTYERPADEYVSRIGEAYDRGDAREAHEIFATLPR